MKGGWVWQVRECLAQCLALQTGANLGSRGRSLHLRGGEPFVRFLKRIHFHYEIAKGSLLSFLHKIEVAYNEVNR